MAAALDGARILDLTQTLAGPYGSLILADLGAEVIKIEAPGQRQAVDVGTFFKGESIHFIALNRNKKSITVDLKAQKGRDVFYDLTGRADVVFDNYRPGVIKRLGVDYETLRSVNPKIISCSVTGFGSSGPFHDRPAYDLVIQAMSGGMSITGDPPPSRAGIPLVDLSGGMFAAIGIIAALYCREKTGVGQKVEVSLMDGQVAMLTYCVPNHFISGQTIGPVGVGQQSDATYRMYKTKDDHIVIAIPGGARFWKNLCKALGREDLATDPRFDTVAKRREHRQQLTALIQDIFLTKTAEEWLAILLKEGVPSGPVNTIEKALTHAQVLHQKMVVPVDFVLGGQVNLAGNPIKMSAAEQVYKSAPTFGQHTEEVLSQVLGYSKGRIARLRREKVI